MWPLLGTIGLADKLVAEAPTIRQRFANVQIVTTPKAMPAVFPYTHNP
jgi:hypothetical protein